MTAEGAAAPAAVAAPPGGAADEAALLRDSLARIAAGSGEIEATLGALARGEPVGAALDLPAGTADLLYAQGFARLDAGDALGASRMFLACAVLDGRRAAAWLGLGVAMIADDRPAPARLALEVARDLDPEGAAAHLHLARLHMAAGDAGAARAALGRFDAARRDAARIATEREAARLRAVLDGGAGAGARG